MVRTGARRGERTSRPTSSGRPAWLFLLLLVGACTTPTSVVAPPPALGTPEPLARKAPAWRFRPLSWAKLEEIERWLDSEGRFASTEQRVEAELTLAEGRLSFAQRDKGLGDAAGVRQRLEAAQAGFQRVLATPSLRALPREQAKKGLRTTQELLGPAPRFASTTFLPRATWRADPAVPKRLTQHEGPWSRLTIHHSAEYAGLLRGKGASESASAIQSIQGYHMDEKGYGDIAYHFLVDPSGRVFEGRSLAWQGAHAGGTNNVRNIGVCLLGDFDREAPTRASLDALARLVAQLRDTHGIAANRVYGHGELKTTACPGRHLRTWLQRYRTTPGSSGLAAR